MARFTNSASASSPIRNIGQVDMHGMLQPLLDDKENQLSFVSTLGQMFLAQRTELEERIDRILDIHHDVDEDDGDAKTQERLQGLADTVQGWQHENESLVAGLGVMLTAAATHAARPTSSPTVAGNEDSQSTADHQDSLLPSMPEDLTQSMGTSARTAAQRRRWAMNARHRANDVEFAFEIGSGLLSEVRRLQALLADRDKALQQLTQEKDHFERTADAEARRVGSDLTTARESGEEHKAESERFNIASQDVLAKYNGDVAQLKREISDLQIALDVCRAEAVQKAATVHQAGDESATSSSNKRNSPNTWRKWRKKMFSSV